MSSPEKVPARLPSGKMIRPGVIRVMASQLEKYERAERMLDEVLETTKEALHDSEPPKEEKEDVEGST
jgi:predicted RNase H-like HicB family nuclease